MNTILRRWSDVQGLDRPRDARDSAHPPRAAALGITCSPHIERAAHGEVSAAGNAGDGETLNALALPKREARSAEKS